MKRHTQYFLALVVSAISFSITCMDSIFTNVIFPLNEKVMVYKLMSPKRIQRFLKKYKIFSVEYAHDPLIKTLCIKK